MVVVPAANINRIPMAVQVARSGGDDPGWMVLDALPRESERRSWIYVAVFTAVVFATIPVARALRNAVDASVGREIFIYLTLAATVVVAVIACRILQRRGSPPAAYVWLYAVLAAFAIFAWTLRAIPEEAIHVAEYGVLGLLVYRALLHRVRDWTIYVAASLVVGMIGIVDEFLQWIAPSRYYDLRDIGINFVAGALAQVAIAAGLRPRLIGGAPARASLARLCRLSAVTLALLLVGFVNTPDRVAWYANQVDELEFLLDGSSHMAEYGHRFEHPEDTGIFRSRFSAAELARLDAERGGEVAAILDRYIRGEGYRPFLARHSVIRDPYAHEAGVHLFRREFHLDRARENPVDPGEHYAIAWRENAILERYFPTAIGLSSHRWNAAIAAEARAGANLERAYESSVSKAIITRVSMTQVTLIFVTLIALLFWLGRRLGNSRPVKTDS